MKTKSAAKSSKAAANKGKKSLAVESSKKQLNKTAASKSKSNAKKDSTTSAVAIPDKHAKTIDSPEVYKNVHNIGRRRATERVVSYKETEIAFSLKDSFWSDAKLDLGGSSRYESTQVKATQEKSVSMSHHLDENSPKAEDRSETKQKPDKLPVVKSEVKSAKTVPSEPRALGEGSASSSGKRGSGFDSPKMTSKTPRGRKSPVLRRVSQTVDAKKSNDDEVEALLSAAVSSDGDDSEDSKQQSSSKRRLQLSSKKRAELSFLARGVSASGCSDVFNRKPKGSDQPQYVRAKRTASLNAGAIMSLMLQKEEPSVSKRDKMQWDDSDDDSDSSSISSESADSTFSEYSTSCAHRLIKRPTKVLTSTTAALASAAASTPAKAVSPKESTSSLKDKEKAGLHKEKHISSTESVLREMPASSDEVAGMAKEPVEKEKASSPVTKTGLPKQNMNFLKASTVVIKDSLSLGARVTKKSSEAKPLPVAITTKNASPSPSLPKNLGSDITEGKGKRKRKEFEEYVPLLGPGRRMASLNAQAILVASRDERVKRSRLSGEGANRSAESETKATSTPTERHGESSAENPSSKTTEKSPPESGKTTQRGAAVVLHADSETGNAKNIAGTSVSDSTQSTSSFCLSNMPSNTGDVGVQFAGTYVGMVSPPSSVQLVEMTSTPVLTPNKTYQQLDRPPNCQQYSSDRQVAPAWAGNPYGVAQFHEMQSNSGLPVDFHKSSSERQLEKAQSNIVTALIPHATSLAPAVPLRFTAHIVPQNPLPQQGFYGQLQPHPPYFSERYPYAGTNLFSYQTKAFGTNTSFATPHIPSDLYNATRQLQVYEVQAARPVYARQSDFNLQLCSPQFIAPAENRDQLYRPYLSPPGHQSFQHAQHPAMCTSYMAPQVQVALAVPSVNHPPNDKPLGPSMTEGHSVGSEQKLLKSSPSESQPNLTDISYSVVKRSGVQRRKQVETKHSSTQVKCHEVALGSSSGSHHSGKRSPDHLKPTGTKLPGTETKREKCEGGPGSAEVASQGSASAHKVAPPAHCQSYAAGSKLGDGMDDLCYADLRNYSAMARKPSPVGTPLQKEYLAKKEDSKPTIIEISDTKPRLDSRDPIPGVSYLKPDNCGVHIDSSSPLKSPQRKLMPPLETPPGVWPREVSAEMHRLGAFAMHTSIIDLSQEKELDLSKKPKVSEAQESSGKRPHGFETRESSGKKRQISETQESSGEAATQLKKKILKNRKTTTEEFANTVKSMDSLDSKRDTGWRAKPATGGQDPSKLVPVSVCSSDSKSAVPVSKADPVSSSLSQLEYFVSHQPGRKPGHDVLPVSEVHSERKTEQLAKSAIEIMTLAKESRNVAVLKNKNSGKDDTVVGTSHLEDNIVKSAVVGAPVALESKELCERSRRNVKKQECVSAEVVLPVTEENVRNIDEQIGPSVTSKPTPEASVFVVQSQDAVDEDSSDFVIDLTKSPKLPEDKLSTEPQLVNCLASKDEATANLDNSADGTSKAKPVCIDVEITEAKPTNTDENSKAKATDSDDATPVTHDDANFESKPENNHDVKFEAKPAVSYNANSEENCVKSDDVVPKPKPATSNDTNLEAKPTHGDFAVSEAKLAIHDDAVAEAKPVISGVSKSEEVNLAVSDDPDFEVKMSTSEDTAVKAKHTVSNDGSAEAQLGSSSDANSDAKPTNSNDVKLNIKLATTCDDSVVDGKSVASDSAISETKPVNSDNGKEKGDMSKSGDTKSQKKYQARVASRPGFATPMKERGHSKKLSRKRMSSISFGKKSSSQTKLVRKCSERKLCTTVAASKVCQKRKLSVDVMPELGARRSQKELIESKTKPFASVGSICKRKTGSEKDKLRRHLSEEVVNQRTNGPKCWKWREPGSMKLTYTEVEGPPVQKMCYPAIEHTNGDVIQVRDCVFVRSGMRKKDIPYIAKIYSFWEHQETGEMMMGVFWYYRQHHSDGEHVSKYLSNEVFASRHRDIIPVACIEDRCYVLTFNEFCRYKAEQKRQDSNLPQREHKVPSCVEPYSRTVSQPPADVDPDVVFLCRNIYDIKMRRILRLSRKLQT